MKNFAILIYSENKIHTNIFPEDYKSSPLSLRSEV